MKTISLTNSDKVVLIDDEDLNRVLSLNTDWFLQKDNDRDCGIYSTRYYPKNFRLQRVILNIHDTKYPFVDHKDGNIFDCRKSNLRLATYAQNNRNKKISKNNACGYKGIYLDKRRNTWYAEITFNYKKIFLGAFKDKILAAIAYDDAAIKYFGEFSKLNFSLYGA